MTYALVLILSLVLGGEQSHVVINRKMTLGQCRSAAEELNKVMRDTPAICIPSSKVWP